MATIPIDSKNNEYFEGNNPEAFKDRISEQCDKDSEISDENESIIEGEEELNSNREDKKDHIIEYRRKPEIKEKKELPIRQAIENVPFKIKKQGGLEVIISFCYINKFKNYFIK